MAKHGRDPLLEALKEGQSYTWTVPDGGDLASMRAALKHGQTLTMSPITDPGEIRVGDLVLVKWHQSDIFHVVGDIQDGKFLIVNSLGKINGWVGAHDVLGRVTKIVEPEPRPNVEIMLEQLEAAYQTLIASGNVSPDEAQRLLVIVDDLRWYAGRIGSERLNTMPRSNKWSFEQNLWRLIKQTLEDSSPVPKRLYTCIDSGKQCVGLASEIVMLFDAAQ